MVVSILPDSSRTVLSLSAALFLLWASLCQGLDISYCSPENNAGSNPSMFSQFQSNGLCQNHCEGSFAFAVLQGYYCWCSNYVPATQQSTYNCDQPCPGFGSDWCGSTDDDLYGYYLLSAGVPLGTSGSGSSTPSSTSSPSFSQSSSSTQPTSTPPSTPDPPPSSSTTPAPTEIYTSVTTVTGEVRTVVVTPSPAASSDATLGQSSTGGGGVSTGKVVGIVLGVALGIGILIGIAVYFWFRRRHNTVQEERGSEKTFGTRAGDISPSNNVPSRQVSQMSTAGLLGSKAPHINLPIDFSGSDLRNADTNNLSASASASDRRSVGTDQRLNPYALYMSEQGRISNVSLQDNQDYSRQLRVANPD